MAGHAGLKRRTFAWLLAGVVVAHVALIERMAGQMESVSLLKAMPKPMYTRVVTPVAVVSPPPPPPPVRAARAPARAAPIARPASQPLREPEPSPGPAPDSAPASVPAPDPQMAAAPAAAEAPTPEPEPMPAPTAAPAGPDLSQWPRDTRLTYQLGGQYRSGPLFGDAQVLWQRDGARYQVRTEVNITPWAHFTMTSQGEVVAGGLAPQLYEEETRGRKRRRAVLEADYVRIDNGTMLPRPPAVQDTASQFVELGHRFATGAIALRAGEVVTVWLARPGGMDLWTYDVDGPITIETPQLGKIEAFHLKPRGVPNPRGNITAQLWFAPSLQYLPVRIRILMGAADYVELTVETIEQK